MSTELEAARYYNRLLGLALQEASDPYEAILAADLAIAEQPLPDTIVSERVTLSAGIDGSLPTSSVDAFFSHDIFNKEAQSILNRALEASKTLTAAARHDLQAALSTSDPAEMGQRILAFINDYRQQLTTLLSATQFAAVLEGAREVARHVPPIPPTGTGQPPPPTLPPAEAASLLERLRTLSTGAQEEAIYQLPADQQGYIRATLGGGSVPPPSVGEIPAPWKTEFPVIEEAAKDLASRNVFRRADFDRLSGATRAKAFTVAGVDSQETLTKIRDALAENVQEQVGLDAFKKKVMEKVGAGTFLSDAHQEVVFRTNIQAAFSDGQAKVLSHPFIRSGFPYVRYDAIHDDRVRHNHLALERHGIGGSNIYRVDDPVFQTFRPPWDYNDRCSWTPMPIRSAAEKGVAEAKKWLETGVEPSPPAFVPMPPFQPPPGFQRSLNAAPLSIRLSLESLDGWEALAETDPPWPRRPAIYLADWQPYQGTGGGKGWVNRGTGEIRYQQNKPSEREGGQQEQSEPAALPEEAQKRLFDEWAKLPTETKQKLQKNKRAYASWQKKQLEAVPAEKKETEMKTEAPGTDLDRFQKSLVDTLFKMHTSRNRRQRSTITMVLSKSDKKLRDAGYTDDQASEIMKNVRDAVKLRIKAEESSQAKTEQQPTQQQPQADPLAGHPMKGMSPEQQLQTLLEHTGAASGEKDLQWQQRMLQVPVPAEAQRQFYRVASEYKKKNPYSAGIPVWELAKSSKLTPAQFQSAMYHMLNARQIRAHAFTGAPYQIPQEAYPYIFPAGQELKAYIEPLEQQGFSLEAFGTESPGPGWTSAGEGRWVKEDDKKKDKGMNVYRVEVFAERETHTEHVVAESFACAEACVLKKWKDGGEIQSIEALNSDDIPVLLAEEGKE